VVNIVINGQSESVADSATVADVVASLDRGANGRGIAVAVNGEVVTRTEWKSRRLGDRDRVEILRAVGGG
jgi:sulfur carrier protein